jgi:hypothetical protein
MFIHELPDWPGFHWNKESLPRLSPKYVTTRACWLVTWEVWASISGRRPSCRRLRPTSSRAARSRGKNSTRHKCGHRSPRFWDSAFGGSCSLRGSRSSHSFAPLLAALATGLLTFPPPSTILSVSMLAGSGSDFLCSCSEILTIPGGCLLSGVGSDSLPVYHAPRPCRPQIQHRSGCDSRSVIVK